MSEVGASRAGLNAMATTSTNSASQLLAAQIVQQAADCPIEVNDTWQPATRPAAKGP